MQLVMTAKGLIDRETLVVKDIVQEHENARVIATEWYTQDGELVRRDVAASILAPLPLTAEQGNVR